MSDVWDAEVFHSNDPNLPPDLRGKTWQPYSTYQATTIEWFGEIPAHWEVKKLKFLAQILRGKFTHRPRNDPSLYEGQYPFIQTGDITSSGKYITEYHQTLNDKGFAISKQFPKGTLVMSIAANVGDLAIIDFSACFPDSIVGFFPYKNVDGNFLYHLLSAMKDEMINTSSINTQLNLNVERISELICTCPPLPEQRQIAAFLDHYTAQIDNLIAAKQELIERLQEERTALISHAVTKGLNPHAPIKESGIEWLGEIPAHWEIIKLKNKVQFQEGPGILATDFRDEGIPLLRISCLRSNFVTLDGCNYLDENMVKERWLHFRVNTGDYLLSASGSLGDMAIVPDNVNGAIPYTGIIRFYKNNPSSIEMEYMRFLFASNLIENQIEGMKSGVAIQHFGPTHLKKMIITYPPLDEQIHISNFLNSFQDFFQRSIQGIQATITHLQEYRAALIAAAVTGQIDVREEVF